MKRSMLLLLLMILVAGCSKAPTATISGVNPSETFFTDGLGVVRTFDFDYERAERQKASRKERTFSTQALPSRVDLRAGCTPVGDQGKLGACTAWALGRGLREHLERKTTGRLVALSPLYLYFKERELQGATGRDCGATITDGAHVLQQSGICPEADWPYLPARFNLRPPSVAEQHAASFKVKTIKPLNSLDQVQSELAQGHTVAFGFRVFQGFLAPEVARTGMMGMPKPGEKNLGGHAALFVGYDEPRRLFIVRNSWGSNWGDRGYCYMPYDFAARYSTDYWTAY